jgi:hypothetical protein
MENCLMKRLLPLLVMALLAVACTGDLQDDPEYRRLAACMDVPFDLPANEGQGDADRWALVEDEAGPVLRVAIAKGADPAPERPGSCDAYQLVSIDSVPVASAEFLGMGRDAEMGLVFAFRLDEPSAARLRACANGTDPACLKTGRSVYVEFRVMTGQSGRGFSLPALPDPTLAVWGGALVVP